MGFISSVRSILAFIIIVLGAHAHAQTFPRLGGYLEGGGTDRQLTPQRIAPLDVVVLGVWQGWTSTSGLSLEQFVVNAKALNPNLKMYFYTDIMESPNPIS